MSPKTRATIFLLTATCIWGFSNPIGRVALEHLSPWAYGGFRFMFGTLSLIPLTLKKRRSPAPLAYTGNFSPRLWLWGGMLGGLCLSCGSMLQLYGLSKVPASQVGFLTTLYVLIVPILAFVAGYVPRLLIIFGMAIGLLGLFLLTGGTARGFGHSEALVLVADVFWALQLIVTGRFAARVNTWLFSFAQALTSSVVVLSMTFFLGHMPGWNLFLATLPYTMWGIFSVGVAYSIQAMAQKTISPTATAMVFPLQAVIGAVAGVFFLGEHMTTRMIIGAAIIILGATIAQFARDSEMIHPAHKYYKHLRWLRVGLGVAIALTTLATLFWALN